MDWNGLRRSVASGCGWIALFVCLLAGAGGAQEAGGAGSVPAASRPGAGDFASPAARFRILKICHTVPTQPAAQDDYLRRLADQGFGGMVTNVSFKDGYVSNPANWEGMVRAVQQAKKMGMALWLYDEKGYPSGNAGGLTMKEHPEWEAEGLYWNDALLAGGQGASLDLPPGKLVRAAAYPSDAGGIHLDKAVDLTARASEGKLAWTAPAGGAWLLTALTRHRLYDHTHAAICYGDKLPYINLLRREPTRRFLEVTHDQYAARLGSDLGRYFIATFTDEPSLMSLFMRPQAFRVIPWSDNLAEEFRRRRGYALEPLLASLFVQAQAPRGKDSHMAGVHWSANAVTSRTRYDFWYTVGQLVTENFCVPIRDWCRSHHTLSGGHMLLEENLVMQVPLYGDFFQVNRAMTAPSIDCLTSIPQHVPWHIARLISSIGELEGRPDTMCETSDHVQRYRPPGDARPPVTVTEEQIRGTCHRLIVNGITTITSYYSFAGLSDEQIRRLNLTIGRSCQTLYGGHQVAAVALLYPVESVWPRFEPARHWVDHKGSAMQVERALRQATDRLFHAARDFTFVDSLTLAVADVSGGVMKVRDLRWPAVVLPGADTLPMRTWLNLRKFWREGGTVVALGSLPVNNESEFPSLAVEDIAKEMFGESAAANAAETSSNTSPGGGLAVYLPPGKEEALAEVIRSRVPAEVTVAASQGGPVRWTHRRIGGRDVYFLINDGEKPCQADVEFAGMGRGEQLDPQTGRVAPLPAPAGGGSAQRVRLSLEGYGAMLYRFEPVSSGS